MGWIHIEYTCGHKEDQQMYGKVKDREATATRLGQHDCPKCRTEALAQVQPTGMPELVGTEKQLGWAMQIRMEKFEILKKREEQILEVLKRLEAGEAKAGVTPEQISNTVKVAQDLLARHEKIKNQTQAGWWITRRNYGVLELENETK